MAKPTRAYSEELISIPKIVSAQVTWKTLSKSYRLEVNAAAVGREEVFKLRGFIGKTNHSFVLLYNNYPIRKFTKHAPHTIGKTIYYEPHKHVWDGKTENMEAYIPDDIDPNDNLNKQFLDFCDECNIEIMGEYQHIAQVR